MKNTNAANLSTVGVMHGKAQQGLVTVVTPKVAPIRNRFSRQKHTQKLAKILIITSYPPRECGIATYSQDLIKALNNKFSNLLSLQVCALESDKTANTYPSEVKYTLNTTRPSDYKTLAANINNDETINIVLIQHEFGFFKGNESSFMQFLYELSKPIVIVFHTILPNPSEQLKNEITSIAASCRSIIVMTNTSADILVNDYRVPLQKISVIAHGTHLVPHLDENVLKSKYSLNGRKVLTTFGLLSSGKSIETTIEALPAIVRLNPEVVFLIIGKTHPEVVKNEGEKYREGLIQKIEQYNLQKHVIFINRYLALSELLEYLQLTDIYLFTSNDPNQAVSGTFVYAMSCACPIISTPIPHAKELLTEDTGIIIDFCDAKQLAKNVSLLLNDDSLRKNISTSTLQKIVSTAWENSAVAHASLFEKLDTDNIKLQYNLPPINLGHLEKMTTDTGIIQFAVINHPDIASGYTLDDNARALIAMCMYFQATGDEEVISKIHKYLNFIKHCQQPEGNFLNYLDNNNNFTHQNSTSNLDDSNGRAIWALGHLVSLKGKIPNKMIVDAEEIIKKSLQHATKMHSTRAMAFTIKGLYYQYTGTKSLDNVALIKTLANRLVQMYKHESTEQWAWFEGYLTYANSILPEALLYAWIITHDAVYKDIAIPSLNFLLSHTFNENGIEVISNRNWLQKGGKPSRFGEQPIDVSYTILTLNIFYETLREEQYRNKMTTAFNWFLGKNRLNQIIYNPSNGGCYDGLEEANINLNQGAESTISYLMARLTIENIRKQEARLKD